MLTQAVGNVIDARFNDAAERVAVVSRRVDYLARFGVKFRIEGLELALIAQLAKIGGIAFVEIERRGKFDVPDAANIPEDFDSNRVQEEFRERARRDATGGFSRAGAL